MNFDQLQYIKSVVEYQSITVAAEKLFVTQSAISQAISTLEKELNVKLFHRSRNGSYPTEEGEWILPKLLKIYHSYQEIKLEIQSRSSEFFGDIMISTIPGIFMTYLPKRLAKLKKDFPNVKPKIVELETKKIVEEIQMKNADIGFIALTHNLKKLHKDVVFSPISIVSHYRLLVSAQSKYANYKEVELQALMDEPFILYGEQFYLELLEQFTQQNESFTVLFQSYNPEVIKKSVMAGLGVSILSDMMLEDDPYIEDGRIKAVKLVDSLFQYPMTLGIIYHKDRIQDAKIQKVVSCLL